MSATSATPSVSVIIPVCNGASFIRDARDSIAAQQYPDIEVIVVDDGSTDGTAAIVDEPGFATRVIRQPNAGPAAARNRGIEAARADVLAFLDADDLWPAGKLARQVEYLVREPELDVVLGRIKYVAVDGAAMPAIPFEDADEQTLTSVLLGSGVFRRRAFDRVGLFDENLRFSEDHDWFLRARELKVRMRILPEVTLVYRLHDQNMTRNGPTRGFDLPRVLKMSLDRRRAAGGPIDLGRWLDAGGEAPLRTSVIIPVFSRVDYLGEALASVAAQTIAADEVIVVSDGEHADPAPVIADAGVETRVVTRVRGGPGAARNTGCAAATGDVLTFLDADDVWLPQKLELQIAALRRDPALDMVFGGVEQFYSPELERPGRPRELERAERAGLLPSSMCVRADAFGRVGGFREGVIFGEFLDWYARAVDIGLRASTIDQTLVRRRVHEHNAGVEFRASRREYARVLKDVLDRRRNADVPVITSRFRSLHQPSCRIRVVTSFFTSRFGNGVSIAKCSEPLVCL